MKQVKEMTPIEKEIDALLQKSIFYLQTYRAIDTQNVLQQAMRLMEGNKVQWQIEAAVYRNMGQTLFQMGNFDNAMGFFLRSYDVLEDGNDKAAAAGIIAGYYLQEGKKQKAMEYAKKALQTATAPELMSHPYQIQGGIALEDEDYPKAIEMFNKAAELAESNHCTIELAMIIMDLSVVYIRMGMLETALSEIFRAERYVKECRNLDLYMRCAIRRAKILYYMGRDEEAKKLICALEEQKC